MTTVRIARHIRTTHGAIIRTEILGEWIVKPEEWPNSNKAKHVQSSFLAATEEEPNMGWTLEIRGTQKGWHAF